MTETPANKGPEQDVIRPFKADGIEEYDNPMPRWWVALFYITIIFGVIYTAWLHMFGGETLQQRLDKDLAALAEQQAAATESMAAGGEDLSTRLRTEDAIAAGKEIYVTNCAPCHADKGQGLVGPNLTDKFWIHGGSDEAIVKVITEGVPEKGMISWQPLLGPQKIEQVAAYVVSLQGTNPEGGKPPEGEEYSPEE